MALPTLDLSWYTDGNAAERQQLASQLLDSLSQHGFVKLVGHGVSRQNVEELLEWVRRDLPKAHSFEALKCTANKTDSLGDNRIKSFSDSPRKTSSLSPIQEDPIPSEVSPASGPRTVPRYTEKAS